MLEPDYTSFEHNGRRFSVRWGNLLVSQQQAREMTEEEAASLLREWGAVTFEESDRDPSGFVYLAHMPATGHYKIGYSKTPQARVNHFDIQMPVEVKMLHSFPADDARACEREIHDWAEPWRVNGEWFALPGGQALLIQYYRGYENGRFVFDPEDAPKLVQDFGRLAPGEVQPHPNITAQIDKSSP